MKFPSIKNLADSAARTFRRFPLEVLFALTGTIAAIINIELDNINRVGENWCIRFMMIANLGLLLSLSATLYSESRRLPTSTKNILRICVAAIAIGLLFLINPGVRQADYIRFLLLCLSLHLLVAFAAFTAKNRVQGFWQFNKTLFLQFLAAALYSVVLGIGLSAAIGAVNYLFNFDFDADTFQILWACIVGMFSTVFFLAGVPANFEELNSDESYPKGLKIFTQYVLIPLATVYVLILLAYEVKIIAEWNLPKGAVSYLILGYAVFGILSLLLVYPIREQEENKWLKTYARSFYFLMIPLLALLFAAVGVRVFRYGITESRYFLVVLACWLLFITSYFLFFKKQNIKLIPVSLCIAALLAVYGPQSAFSVSEYSQRRVLTELLQRNHALKNGKALPLKKVSGNEGRRILSVLEYLVNHHDLESLQPLFNEDLEKVSESLGKNKSELYTGFGMTRYELRRQKIDWVREKLKIGDWGDYIDDKYVYAKNKYSEYRFRIATDISVITGYNYAIPVSHYYNLGDTVGTQTFEGIRFYHTTDKHKNYVLIINNKRVVFNPKAISKQLLSSEKEFTEKYKAVSEYNIGSNIKEFALPPDRLMFTKDAGKYVITLAIRDINVSKSPDAIDVTSFEANYLIKEK